MAEPCSLEALNTADIKPISEMCLIWTRIYHMQRCAIRVDAQADRKRVEGGAGGGARQG